MTVSVIITWFVDVHIFLDPITIEEIFDQIEILSNEIERGQSWNVLGCQFLFLQGIGIKIADIGLADEKALTRFWIN